VRTVAGSARLSLSLLGTFTLRRADEVVRLPGTTQRLLAFLAIRRRPLPRTHLAGSLWPETAEQRASGNLRTALWRLGVVCPEAVDAGGECIGLGVGVDVDLYRAVALAQDVIAGHTDATVAPIASLTAVADVLPGWYEDWLTVERETFLELRLRALEESCRQLAAEERFGEAIVAGLAAVSADPLRESSHRALIRAYLLEGNQALALRQYRHCQAVLADELGVAPSSRMATLLSEHGLLAAAV
jgi:DNA-binding SARP family transcriptional activator